MLKIKNDELFGESMLGGHLKLSQKSIHKFLATKFMNNHPKKPHEFLIYNIRGKSIDPKGHQAVKNNQFPV
jgi:hypothetical protein